MNILNLFKPKVEPEVPVLSVVPDEDDYEYLIVSSEEARIRYKGSEVDNAWVNTRKYGLPTTSSAYYPPLVTACSTGDFDYPIQPMSESKYEPLAEWVCEWCGNMWPSDTQSCEKCGGPKGTGNDR